MSLKFQYEMIIGTQGPSPFQLRLFMDRWMKSCGIKVRVIGFVDQCHYLKNCAPTPPLTQ